MSLENDALVLGSKHEVARILRRLAHDVLADGVRAGDGGKLRDANGNTVGSWEVTK